MRYQMLFTAMYPRVDPDAWAETKKAVSASDVASWLGGSSYGRQKMCYRLITSSLTEYLSSDQPDVFGASIKQILPMYPTLRPSAATMSAKATSESMMTGSVRLSGETLHSMNAGMRPEICHEHTIRCLSKTTRKNCLRSQTETRGYMN